MSLRRIAVVVAACAATAFTGSAAFAAPATPTPSPSPATAAPATPQPSASAASPAPSSAATATPSSTATPTSAGASSGPTTTGPVDPNCDQSSMMCSGAPASASTAALVSPDGKLVSGGAMGASGADAASTNPWTYINQVAPWAVATQAQYGVPASVTIAQSALESGWGQSGLTIQGNAYFGIKCSPNGYMSPWQNSCLDFPTQEWSAASGYYTIDSYFRGYPSAQNSFMDHGLFLVENSRYASAFTTTNSDDFIRQVAADGYATDPNYANSVIGIMQNYNLYMYDSPGWQIQALYGQMGGNSSYLGNTTSDITCGLINGGCYQTFDGGTGYWSAGSGAHMVHGAILAKYAALGYEHSKLGFPTGDETCGIKNNGCYQSFQGGTLYWSSTTGAHAVWGAIAAEYQAVNLEHSPLGLPTSDEVCGIKNNGCYEFFEGGTIYWSSSTHAHEVWGAINAEYRAVGYENGKLGLPVTDEVCGIKNNGCYQSFEGGDVYWSQATKAHEMWGAIGGEYRAVNLEHSPLGLPTSDEVCGIKDNGCYQIFEGGVVYWSQATGAHETWGGIRGRYAAMNLEHSALGLPTGDEVCGMRGGGCYQLFEGGALYWSPASGAWESLAPLRAYYASKNYQDGTLGYPTGAQNKNADGSVSQTYQGGTLTWTQAGGVRQA